MLSLRWLAPAGRDCTYYSERPADNGRVRLKVGHFVFSTLSCAWFNRPHEEKAVCDNALMCFLGMQQSSTEMMCIVSSSPAYASPKYQIPLIIPIYQHRPLQKRVECRWSSDIQVMVSPAAHKVNADVHVQVVQPAADFVVNSSRYRGLHVDPYG